MLALVVTFAIGAAVFIPVVQRDLEDRVESEFGDAGFDGVRASFSGQDGTLTCDEPFEDPAAAEVLGEGVYGVRIVDLDASCSGGESDASDETAPSEVLAAEPPGSEPPVAEPAESTTTTEAPPDTDPGDDGIVEIVEGDPLFSQLAGVLVTAGLDGDDAFGGDGPITLLAPTDAAFDAAFDDFGADAFDSLMSDPVALRTVLLHHATDGVIRSSDFVAGELEMLDGTTITVDPDAPDGITFTSNATVSGVEDPATQLDIETSNGTLHAIDRLLIPEGLDFGDPGARPTAVASFAGGQLVLSGVVANEEQRAVIVTAAQTQVDPGNVIDELAVDADVELDPADVARFSALVAAMPPTLVGGEAMLDGAELTLTGTYRDDQAFAVMSQVGTDQAATLELTPRLTADADSAAALQSELNEFVRANPIQFEPNSAAIVPEANAVIDRLAARAARLAGTAITIVGHTDSDGNPFTNQTLSELRALSVLDALAQRGADAATLTSAGRGSTEPIVDASGAEDKAASRRVEFVVVPA